MNQRLNLEVKKEDEKAFLRKNKSDPQNPICLNSNKFFTAVIEESNEEDLPSISSKLPSLDISKQVNQVIPIGDLLIEKKIQESIKSILCPNFLTDRKGLFSKLFDNKAKGINVQE
jgi:hypothetical protein